MNDKDFRTEALTKRKNGYVLLTLIFTVLGMIGQTVVVLYGYDASMKGFKLGNPLGTLVGWGLALTSVLLLSALFTLKGAEASLQHPDHLTTFLSALAGGAVVAASVMIALEFQKAGGALATVSSLMALLSLPTGAYLILQGLLLSKGEKVITALGFFPVIWGAMALMRIYFDNNTPINDPLRLLLQVALVAMMLAFLGELKIRVGKKGAPLFFAMAGVSLLLGASSAISTIVLRIVIPTVPTSELMLAIADLLLSLYLFVRMVKLSKPADKTAEK